MRGLFLCLALGALVALGGCQRLKDFRKPKAEPASLSIQLDKASYRPGEPVRINARLATGGKPMTLRALDADSIVFYYRQQGEPEAMERRAVASRKEPMGLMVTTTTLERTFLMTRLTQYGGPMTVVAIYDPNSLEAREAGGRLAPRITSNVVQFKVEGERMFAREQTSGLINAEEARRLAVAQALQAGLNKPLAGDILSVQDEMGFYKWYVNVRSPGKDGIDELTGWIVNPYTGTVNQLRLPFNPSLTDDGRLIRKSTPQTDGGK